MLRSVVLALIAGVPAVSLAQTPGSDQRPPVVPHSDGAPFTLARSMHYDFTSRITGQKYRVTVSTPFTSSPEASYPIVYLLDGNQYFATATEVVTRLWYPKSVTPAIIVGIEYPTDDPVEAIRRRSLDLTPSVAHDRIPGITESGGGDAFLSVIEDEVKPLVMSRYRVDRNRQTIYGQSLGGLMVLRSLFRNPTAFSTYNLWSPLHLVEQPGDTGGRRSVRKTRKSRRVSNENPFDLSRGRTISRQRS